MDARATSLYVREPAATERVDLPLLVALSAALGALLLMLSCSSKYFRHRARNTEPAEFRFFLTEYWTWPERAAFLFLALCAWLALGIAGGYMRGIRRLEGIPFDARFGSFASPSTAVYFETELPASPEQRMLAGLARHTGPVAASAVPTPEQMERALELRVPMTRVVLWAAGGPINAGSFLRPELRYLVLPQQSVPAQITVILTCLLLPLAMFILLVPRQEIYDQQTKLWEVLVPAAAWSWLGGLVLLAFCFFLVQTALVYANGSPCFVAWTCNPYLAQHLQWRYGLEGASILPSSRPSAFWLYGAPLTIWALNFICVFLRPSSSLKPADRAALRP